MICTIKQSTLPSCVNGLGSNSILNRRTPCPIRRSFFTPPLEDQGVSKTLLAVSKPLHVSSIERLGSIRKSVIKCKAYESDRSQPVKAPDAKLEAAKRVKIGIYFATWWALNVVFNIYNKKLLNAYPCP